MSSYVGNRSNDPQIDFMLDTLEDRGYDPKGLDAAVEAWHESEDGGEDTFWTQHLGPTIDALERTLGHYGLTLPENTEDTDATD